MAVIYDNKICVLASELIKKDEKRKVGSDNGFITYNTFNSQMKRGQITILRRGSRGNSALVDWESMKYELREQYISIYGDPRVAIASAHKPSLLEQVMSYSNSANEYFTRYRYDNDKTLPQEKIAEYTLNARVIDAIFVAYECRRQREVGGGSTRINKWERLSTLANELRLLRDAMGNKLFPHTLPEAWKSLKRKCEKYKDAYKNYGENAAYDTLIHKSYGNKYASKVVSEEEEAVMHTLIGLHNNLNNEQIRSAYNKVAGQIESTAITSPKTIGNYKKRMSATTTKTRRGKSVASNTLTRQAHRAAPVNAMTYWTLDGWTVELFYRKTKVTNKNGKQTQYTTYTNRKTVVIVLDACGKYPVGYAIGDNESPALIKEALRDAFLHIRELFGERFMPMQLQSDNYQTKVLTPIYQAIAGCYTPASIGNAKAKIIEPYFGYLNKTYCQIQQNWSGFGITADKKNQPNLAYINEHHDCIPDEDTVISQIHAIINAERGKGIEAYRKAWADTPVERKKIIGSENYLLALGEVKERTNKFTPSGLIIERAGNRTCYDTFNKHLRNYLHEDWIVRYDPQDDSEVLISNAKRLRSGKIGEEIGNLRFLLQKEHKMAMAIADQSEEDKKHLSKIRAYNKELEERVQQKLSATSKTIERLTQRVPSLMASGGILDAHLICDSRGQHKDRRSEARELSVEEVTYEELPVIPPTEEEDYEFNPADMAFSR